MKTVYYFAYGSNMNTRYLSEHRRVNPQQSLAASIEGYQVRFTQPGVIIPPFSYLEPAFALLVESVGELAHGVVHKLGEQDIDRIGNTEGSHYRWQELEATTSGGEKVLCQTLVGSDKLKCANPSRRYLNLCLEGAIENQLPEAYLNELRNLDSVYYRGLSEAMGVLIRSSMKLSSLRAHSLSKRNK